MICRIAGHYGLGERHLQSTEHGEGQCLSHSPRVGILEVWRLPVVLYPLRTTSALRCCLLPPLRAGVGYCSTAAPGRGRLAGQPHPFGAVARRTGSLRHPAGPCQHRPGHSPGHCIGKPGGEIRRCFECLDQQPSDGAGDSHYSVALGPSSAPPIPLVTGSSTAHHFRPLIRAVGGGGVGRKSAGNFSLRHFG